ncbi:MAG: DUF3458 domain-containing protein, partial [Chromatiales bacterium]|nr:DUF3458 domain-containing protein [Chromatiales bacterium]
DVLEVEQTFVFADMPEKPVPSLLRGFSAPVKLNYDYSREELMFLMKHDTDGFNRWDAAQRLSQRILLGLVGSPDFAIPDGYIEACRQALNDGADKQLLAEVLTLPSESYLGDLMTQVDVDGIHRARERLKRVLAERLYDDLLNCYHSNSEQGEYDLSPDAIGRRALKNLALSYLVQADRAEGIELCMSQYRQATNMTDMLAALSLVADTDSPAADELLEDFYQRWQSDPLVVDKWFTVQAIAKRADTLERVKGLLEHPAFSITNPNKVRALIGAFCAGNVVRFHDVSGAGYRFLVDQIITLDSLNPQVAARMLRIISRWQRYDEQRQTLMREQLQRILDSHQISKDLYEIVSKSLA